MILGALKSWILRRKINLPHANGIFLEARV
jgi:hypothetical protein